MDILDSLRLSVVRHFYRGQDRGIKRDECVENIQARENFERLFVPTRSLAHRLWECVTAHAETAGSASAASWAAFADDRARQPKTRRQVWLITQ
jgi:hypothetical protein